MSSLCPSVPSQCPLCNQQKEVISQRTRRMHKDHCDSLNLCGHCNPRKEGLIERGVPKVEKSLYLNQGGEM